MYLSDNFTQIIFYYNLANETFDFRPIYLVFIRLINILVDI